MNSYLRSIAIVLTLTIVGCSDKAAAERKAQADAEAKARAAAERKEMERVPDTFKPRYNKKLDPSSPTESAPQQKSGEPGTK